MSPAGTMVVEALVAVFLVSGAAFTLIGAIGLVRFPDFLSRLHAPTKATTLGVGNLLIGSAIHFTARGPGVSLHELLIVLFLFITAPVSAHLLARAGRHLGLERCDSGESGPRDSVVGSSRRPAREGAASNRSHP